MSSVQYRVVLGKKDELVEGPDDAELVITVPITDIALGPVVAFMQGKLKSTGSTGRLFALMQSGELEASLAAISPP